MKKQFLILSIFTGLITNQTFSQDFKNLNYSKLITGTVGLGLSGAMGYMAYKFSKACESEQRGIHSNGLAGSLISKIQQFYLNLKPRQDGFDRYEASYPGKTDTFERTYIAYFSSKISGGLSILLGTISLKKILEARRMGA